MNHQVVKIIRHSTLNSYVHFTTVFVVVVVVVVVIVLLWWLVVVVFQWGFVVVAAVFC